MNYANLLDGTSAAIVVGGTLVATVLRCGLRDCLVTLSGLAGTLRPGFDADKTRAELAQQIQTIQSDGLLRAEPRHFSDEEFGQMADTLIEQRSLNAIITKHNAHKALRAKASGTTVGTLCQAAEMGPVFGLVGTLVALSQLQSDPSGQTMLTSSIPTAIITTFYGLIIANMVFSPLARFVQRRAIAEEEQRQSLIDWLTLELSRDGLMGKPRPRQVAA